MTTEADRQRAVRRAAVLAGIIVLHAALVLVVLRATPPPADPVLQQVVRLVTVRAVAAPPDPTPVVQPPTVEPAPAALVAPAVEIATPTAPPAATPGGDACAVEPPIAAALDAVPQLAARLLTLGPQTRPATGAVMVWNGAWARGENAAEAATLRQLRTAVLAAVAQAPPACGAAALVGPRFISVGSGGALTMLAIGSGSWHWSDLSAR